MSSSLLLRSLAVGLTVLAPMTSYAHRSFLVPSSTVLADAPNQWVSVDAARGNELFFFNHNAMPTDGLTIIAPDGQQVAPAKLERFRYRAVLDWQLTQPGTWRAAVIDDGLRVRWEENGQAKRWAGPASELAKALPPNATSVSANEVSSRVETFITMGAPTTPAVTGRGLEAVYAPHPNDLIAGDSATLSFLLDGQPASDLKVTVQPGAVRYRNAADEIQLVTDARGQVTLQWPSAGLYWVNVAVRGESSLAPARQRIVSYTATLEVLPR
jgi:hypothetical protein